MYIIQVGDLHIGSAINCGEPESQILAGGIEKIKQEVPVGQQLLVCVCGDIIDSKNLGNQIKRDKQATKKRYEQAAELFTQMQEHLADCYSVTFRFCVGNHDTTHMDDFFDLAHQFDASPSKEEYASCYTYMAEGIHYIFINSSHNGTYQYGEIDYDRLEQLLKTLPAESPKVFVMHHTVISMYPTDNSSIRDAARLLQILEANHVLGVLHGHIHGNERFPFGAQMCQMIGTGALFSRNNPNVCSQFNIIYVDPFAFRNISTCIYLADNRGHGNHWHKLCLQEDGNENYFQGPAFSTVHQKLMGKLHYKPVLNNVVLQINCTYDDFISDLEQYLRDDVLSMGENQFSYFELAEKWESTTLPSELYFNHGRYFQSSCCNKSSDSEHAIRTIIQQIKDAPTSNRAVLTTFSTDKALRPRGGDDYLPSLLSIQFSLDSNQSTLYVHMNLRALEAGSFLKINICEIQWLLRQMKEENVRFDNVDIAISAFRVQIRERFKCFLRAEIDNLDSVKLYGIVFRGEISRICCMLEEKRDSSETITNVHGIKGLSAAMQEVKDAATPGSPIYSDEIIGKLQDIQSAYVYIDQLQRRGSVRTDEEKMYEAHIRSGLNEIIEMLKQEGGAAGA